MRKAILFMSMPMLLAGCTHQAIDAGTLARAHAPVVCGEKAQCDKLWQGAQAWVAQHAGYKIQMVSDVLIQTYGPAGQDTGLAYSVIKEPGAYNTYTIKISAICGNILGCTQPPVAAIADFKDYLLTL